MNISLTKDLEKYIQIQMETGHYASVSEVIREALRNQMKQSKTIMLDEQIRLGQAQVKEGRVSVANKKFFDDARKLVRDNYSS